MRVLVTGANGFVGRALVRRLLHEGLDGCRVDQVVAADLGVQDRQDAGRLRVVEGSMTEPEVLQRMLAEPLDAVFHLASVPGGAAEKDPDLARSVNLDGTVRLLDGLRCQGGCPRLVFASTIAVYGDPLPAVVDEDSPVLPAMTYGAQKLASEILIADADRRGWVKACSIRLPGVVARPGDGAGLISAFMSQLFWKLKAGEPIVLPVSADGRAWWISVAACVENLLFAGEVDCEALGPRRVVQMPALHLAIRDVVAALARTHGEPCHALVRYEPQERVQRLFASYPPLRTPRAFALGFRHDGSADALARRATGDETWTS